MGEFYNILDDTNGLINSLWYNHYFLTFRQVFYTLLVCFLPTDQKMIYC